MTTKILLFSLLLTGLSLMGRAQTTERIYLSGRDGANTVEWDFRCSKGMQSGKWRHIAVPSCWEQQGFGEYTYGRYYKKKDGRVSDETGAYRYKFNVPANWQDKTVRLTFDGVMTDALVKVNGQQAGQVHQGGFTSFSYDVTQLIVPGKQNLLEVEVKKQSDEKSVNSAERRADWWLFGGIYRPVYMEAMPKTHIDYAEVDAKADGTLRLRLHTAQLPAGCSLRLAINGQTNILPLEATDTQTLTSQWLDMKVWDPDHPNLYTLRMQLVSSDGRTIHETTERIGFRTMEFRQRDGFYLNGTHIIVKGINRHCFYPETGRTTSRLLDINDARLVKLMNANAIRSHYPPDKHFLDICDSLGILYFDELPGWQNSYNTATGTRILREMMRDDANHPCIFAWGNGNEGGFNYNLDGLFAEYDLQGRHVVHPWAHFDGVDAHHYPAYQTGVGRLHNGYDVFMPTEFLHSQYDKGGGASLDDYWKHWMANPLFAGGFIWAMIDEGVCRTDRNGEIDTDGTNAPDGIVGPHREKEASWFTIRDVWSPIQIAPLRIRQSWNGKLSVSNASQFSMLSEYRMHYRTLSADINGGTDVLAEGDIALPAAEPGETSIVTLPAAAINADGDILQLVAFTTQGDTMNVWSWPMKYADEYYAAHLSGKATTGMAHADSTTLYSANGVRAVFDRQTGMISRVYINKVKEVAFGNGPIPVGMKMQLKGISTRQDGNDALFVVHYTGAVDSIVWRMTPNGRLGMDAVLLNDKGGHGFKGDFFDKEIRNFGFSFSYPEAECEGMRWMGKGPYRVWRNRLRGQTLGVWQKDYNNTVTGESWQYPEFKGYHAQLYWAEMLSKKSPLRIFSETDGLYYRVFTPEEPKEYKGHTMQSFPEGDISFLLEIPGIQSYKPIEQLGPEAQPSHIRINKGDHGLRIKLWFEFVK